MTIALAISLKNYQLLVKLTNLINAEFWLTYAPQLCKVVEVLMKPSPGNGKIVRETVENTETNYHGIKNHLFGL